MQHPVCPLLHPSNCSLSLKSASAATPLKLNIFSIPVSSLTIATLCKNPRILNEQAPAEHRTSLQAQLKRLCPTPAPNVASLKQFPIVCYRIPAYVRSLPYVDLLVYTPSTSVDISHASAVKCRCKCNSCCICTTTTRELCNRHTC